MSSRTVTVCLAVLLLAAGCASTKPITRRSQLMDLGGKKPISVYMKNNDFYSLHRFALGDSVIRGTGTLERSGKKRPFSGAVPLDSIVAIEARSSSDLRFLAGLASAGLFVAVVAQAAQGERRVSADEDIHVYYPEGGDGGGSSCPYVYSWNGRRYVLEAEPFGTGLGRGLEVRTSHLLPSARSEDGIVRVRLTNERQETHYVNSLELFAIDAGAAPDVVLDTDGAAWPVVDPQPPLIALASRDADILKQVARVDGVMWECEPASFGTQSGYEDILELRFFRPPDSQSASLILTGINTRLSTRMIGALYQAAGDQRLALMHSLDDDPEMVAYLRQYLDDFSLKVSIWDGREWQPAGAFRPEANAVTFTRCLRLDVPPEAGETIRVRLRSLADVWKVDAFAADWTPASPLPMHRLSLVSASGPAGADLREVLDSGDGRYIVLLPPDRVDLTYAADEDADGGRTVYAVTGQGYLHEWVTGGAQNEVASLMTQVPGGQRIDFIKGLLQHRELTLRPIYEQWAEERGGAR